MNPGESLPANSHISVEDANEKVKDGSLVLVDIRTPQEWMQTGIPDGALAISMNHPGGAEGFMQDVDAALQGDREAPLAIICRTGARTAQMQQFLWSQGYKNVLNVTEGMQGSFAGPGWLRSGLPIKPYTE